MFYRRQPVAERRQDARLPSLAPHQGSGRMRGLTSTVEHAIREWLGYSTSMVERGFKVPSEPASDHQSVGDRVRIAETREDAAREFKCDPRFKTSRGVPDTCCGLSSPVKRYRIVGGPGRGPQCSVTRVMGEKEGCTHSSAGRDPENLMAHGPAVSFLLKAWGSRLGLCRGVWGEAKVVGGSPRQGPKIPSGEQHLKNP